MEPSPTPELDRLIDELAAACLPPWLARVEDLRRGLEARLGGLAAQPGETDPESVSEADLGWVLGALSSARGADLLRVRQSRAALRSMLRVLAGTGLVVHPALDSLPDLASACPRQGLVTCLFGWLFVRAAGDAREVHWDHRRAGQESSWTLEPRPAFTPGEGRAWCELLPGLEPKLDGRGRLESLGYPAAWSRQPGSP